MLLLFNQTRTYIITNPIQSESLQLRITRLLTSIPEVRCFFWYQYFCWCPILEVQSVLPTLRSLRQAWYHGSPKNILPQYDVICNGVFTPESRFGSWEITLPCFKIGLPSVPASRARCLGSEEYWSGERWARAHMVCWSRCALKFQFRPSENHNSI